MERDELRKIYNKHKNMVYRIALTYCRNIQDAEDITQEVFLTRFTIEKFLPSEEAEKAWLIRVTINKCKDMIKSFYRKRSVPLEEIKEVCQSPSETNVMEAVNSLPDKYRIAIHLYYIEGYSIKEISELTFQTETSIQTQLYRARKKLKKILKEDF